MTRITSLSGTGGEAPPQAFSFAQSATADDEETGGDAEFQESEEGSEAPESELVEAGDESEGEDLPESPDDAEVRSDALDDGLQDDDAADQEDAASAEDGAPREPEVTGEPFRYTAGRQTYELPGATQYSNGWVGVDPGAVPEVARLVAQGRYYETDGRNQIAQARREAQVAKAAVHEGGTRGEALFMWLHSLATAPPGPDGKDAQTRIFEFLVDQSQMWPKMQAVASEGVAKAYYDQAMALQAGDPEERARVDAEQWEHRSDATIMSALQQVGDSADYKELSDRDIELLGNRLDRSQAALYTRATEPDPMGRWAAGDLIVNNAYLVQEAQAALMEARTRRVSGAAVTAARAHNARRLGNRPSRPTASGAREEPSEAALARRGPKTWDEFQQGIYRKMQTVPATAR